MSARNGKRTYRKTGDNPSVYTSSDGRVVIKKYESPPGYGTRGNRRRCIVSWGVRVDGVPEAMDEDTLKDAKDKAERAILRKQTGVLP